MTVKPLVKEHPLAELAGRLTFVASAISSMVLSVVLNTVLGTTSELTFLLFVAVIFLALWALLFRMDIWSRLAISLALLLFSLFFATGNVR